MLVVFAIEGDVDGAMIGRIEAPGPQIIGRKDATDEGYDGKGVIAIVTDGINIPPDVAARRN
jgi:hypothetical protein